MEPAKLQFSEHEMKLVSDAEWILTKNEILSKISWLMGALNENQKRIINELAARLPEEILTTTPKISRGENYKGLPYLVLDYPRNFAKHNIFAIRSMFWWGRTLSTTLHLSGKWQKYFAEKILNNYELLSENSFVIFTGENEWVHDVTGGDYTPVKNFTKDIFKEILSDISFIKLALFTRVNDLNNGNEVWEEQFKKIVSLL